MGKKRCKGTLFLAYVKEAMGQNTYRIAGKFGGELNLALWRIDQPTAKLKIRPPARHSSRIIMGVVDLGHAHERKLIVDLGCFLTCMLGGVRFYYHVAVSILHQSWHAIESAIAERQGNRKRQHQYVRVD